MENFDVFISFKNTDAFQNVTPDYEIAKNLQKELEKQGLTTFFSEKSIQKLGESDYKRAIDDALDSSKILIVVGTKVSYIRSKWVEYEWESFENDILNGLKEDSRIITYTSSIDTRELPRTLRNYQNFAIENASIPELVEFTKTIYEKICSHNDIDELPEVKEIEDPAKKIEKKKAIMDSYEMEEVKSKNLLKPRHKSVYNPEFKSELERLKVQAENTLKADQKALDYVFEKLKDKKDLSVLDIGCAYGFVTSTRFSGMPQVKHIIGIDNKELVIDKAKDFHLDDDKLMFSVMDVEADDFVDNLTMLLNELEIHEVDIIYSSLTIHHLKNPDRVLRKLRKFLKKDGFIILRGSDDGTKMCYPYSELMNEIFERTLKLQGVSDRMNGRKIFGQLMNSGYKDVKVFSSVKDLSQLSFDEHEAVFNESFSWRINYAKNALDKDPDNEKYQQDYEWMKNALEEFEKRFFECNFWYCEYDYVGVGRK